MHACKQTTGGCLPRSDASRSAKGSVLRFLALALLILGLTACGHTPVTRTVLDAVGSGRTVDQIQPNPSLRYLRVTVDGRTLLMVLGYVDPADGGPIETWYSSAGEVIRIQGGRIVSTSGLSVDWRAVRYSDLPSWKQMLSLASAQFSRQRDEMPGYRFGISQQLDLRPIQAPDKSSLVGLAATDLRWFEESLRDQPSSLRSSRYGLRVSNGEPSVVYAQHCLSRDLCLSWQTWPVTP